MGGFNALHAVDCNNVLWRNYMRFEIVNNYGYIIFQETDDSFLSTQVALTDGRNTIIAKIMRTRFTVDEEFALINNRDEVEYQEYQQFRTSAKSMADEFLSYKGNP